MTASLEQPRVLHAGDGGATSQRENVLPVLLVFKMKISSNPAEIQRIIEGYILITAGTCTFGVQVRELRAVLLNPGKRVFHKDNGMGYERRQGRGCLVNETNSLP